MSEEAMQEVVEDIDDGIVIEAETEEPGQETVQESDSSPDTEGVKPEVETAPEVEKEDPPSFEKRINKKHFEMMEERRKREALEQQLAEMQARIPQNQRPEIPPLPDPFDDDYSQRIQARDQAIQNATAFDAQQAMLAQQQQAAARQAEEARNQALVETAKTYSERATKLGVDASELQQAGNVVAQYGLNVDMVESILADEHGPLMTKYLASNPAELDDLSRMNPYAAGMKLVDIKAKAAGYLTKKQTAPDPVDPIKGAGAKPDDGLEGATYE